MNKIIKLFPDTQTDRQKSVNDTLKDFTELCQKDKAEGVILIAYRRDKDKEIIASFSSNLRYSEKMGMLEEARSKFNHE
jgi:hypothetical protein